MTDSYLPSKHIIWFGVFALFIIGGVAYAKYQPFPLSTQENQEEKLAVSNARESDPSGASQYNQSDQFATGTQTLTESDTNATSVPSSLQLENGKINKTQQQYQKVLPEVARLAQSGDYSQQELTSVLRNLLTEDTPDFEKLTQKDITIIPGSTKNFTRSSRAEKYARTLRNTIQAYKDKQQNMGKELQILARSIKENKSGRIKELQAISSTYRQMVTDLQKVRVPKEFVSAHLRLLNGFLGMSHALDNMQYYFEDPIRANSAMTTYEKHSKENSVAMQTILKLVELRK